MAANVPPAERLLALLSELLHAERPLTADELWERVPGYDPSASLGSLRRAFERDKDVLRAQGVPIETVDVPGIDPPREGYRIDRSRYYLDVPALESDELAALRLASLLVRVGEEDQLSERALWRLGGVVADDDGTVLASFGAAAGAPGPVAEVYVLPGMDALFTAITTTTPVEVLYNDVVRVLHPYRLDAKWGRWYLTAHDTTHGEMRRFRVDRLAARTSGGRGATDVVRLLEGTFDRPEVGPGPPPDVWAFGEGETVTARLLVDASQVARLRHEVEDGALVEIREDGSAVFTFEVRNREGFRWLVLGLLEHGEVLEPPELRDEVVGWLERLS